MIKFITPEDRIVYGLGGTVNGTVNLSDKEKGALERIGSDKNGYWKIQKE